MLSAPQIDDRGQRLDQVPDAQSCSLSSMRRRAFIPEDQLTMRSTQSADE